MKFDMHVKNIGNMKFNSQIFKIYTKKKQIYEKFEEFFFKLFWRETLFLKKLYTKVTYFDHPNNNITLTGESQEFWFNKNKINAASTIFSQ